MTTFPSNRRNFMRRHISSLFMMTILLISGFIPFLYHSGPYPEPPAIVTPPIAEISPHPININLVAGESNFTRESWPFILDNYPQFNWKNPGQFNGSQNTAGNILCSPTAATRGYDKRLPVVGAGPEKYPALYNSISGLNESNIRIMYLDANYNWISVPYQIDQRGWANVWYPADLNKWAGLGAMGAGGSTGSAPEMGAGEHFWADLTVGLGWIAGDPANSEGLTNYGLWNYGAGANNIVDEWYRIPIWTYVSPRQPDGTITDERVQIDPEYRDNLIWVYQQNASRPHTAWLSGDTQTLTNAWNVATGAASGRTTRTEYPRYARINPEGWRPSFINTTTWVDPWVNPMAGKNNVVFMGDTWFTTPGNYANTAGGESMPQWVRNAFPYVQINGAVDKDDQICFYVYNGRQAPSWLWWNFSYFPQRYELKIVDPVDGGQTWMYIYYNNETAWNPLQDGTNLGAPVFTTTDAEGNPIDYYVSWDPTSNAVTTDFYRATFNRTPNMASGLRLFGTTDGQSILTQFNKMYIYGHVSIIQGGQTALNADLAFGRQGVWYRWPSTPPITQNFNEIVATLDNPSVCYPGIARDNSILIAYAYGGGQYTADRRAFSLAPQCPQNYYGPQGITRHPTFPAFLTWGRTTGDQRAVISGPCRVIFYYQSFLLLGAYYYMENSGTIILNDNLDFVFPIMDGPQIYYRRMQISPETSFEIPIIAGASFQVYYAYLECGTINPAVRNDLNVTAVQEWSGGADGIDQHEPKFNWANQYGYTKIGGLNPKTTGYNILGFSTFNSVDNQTNYYKSQGDPLLQTNPVTNTQVCPPDGNNRNLCDWMMVTSQTHGGVWLYTPRREANESRDNNRRAGQTAELKMYFRDDGGPLAHPEFGICLDGGTNPWIQGGTTTSPYHLMMVYGEFDPRDAAAIGHKLYCNYYFPLEGTTTLSSTPAPGPRFVFQSAQPDKLIYKTGNQINILVTGTPKNATIYANTQNIHNADASQYALTNRGDGSWNLIYIIDGVTGPSVNRFINLTAAVPSSLVGWWSLSTYYLNITIDNTPPARTAQLAALPGTTTETSVLLSWSAIPGFDSGCASMANPSGLGWYCLRRGTISGMYDTILADDIPLTTSHFVDSFIENGRTYYYKLDTYDAVGNVNTTAIERSTLINLPYTPAQPAALPSTKNPMAGIVIDWTPNPGYGVGVTITGYRVYRSTSLGGTYMDISGLLGSGVKVFTDSGSVGGFVETTTYYYKVLTETAGTNLYSAAVFTRIDSIAPAPAELATPLPTYRAVEAEILVSWSIEIIPEYQTGGFPGHDLNGIDHWVVYKKIGTGSWRVLENVPYSPLSPEQSIKDIAVVNGTTYFYSIRTFDSAGNSALCSANRTTKLWVVGPGKAEIYSVAVGSVEVKQGATSIPVTVWVRNPGTTSITLDEVHLYLYKFNITQEANVTQDYQGVIIAGGGALAAYANRSFAFSVNVSASANLGIITVDAQAVYNTIKQTIGSVNPSHWLVTSDVHLIIDIITSPKSVVHPGEQDIPVTVKISNPGKCDAAIETIQLSFVQAGLDITDKFLVEQISSLPTSGFSKSSKFLNFNVTVSQSVTAGGVIVNAIVTGKGAGVSLEDTDGAVVPLTWAVQTSATPIIARMVTDREVYWTGATIRLTVTCEKAGHTVSGFFGPLDGSMLNETGTDNGDRTYTIVHTVGAAIGENTYTAIVYVQNTSGTASQSIRIRLGQAPTFSGWIQTPTDGNVESFTVVDIDIQITDNNGAATIQASLKYRMAGGTWNVRPMTHTAGTHWDAIIPAQNMGGLVEYIINATDMAGNWALYSKSYIVRAPYSFPIWLAGSQKVCDPNNPSIIYNDTNPAPRDTPIAYIATFDTQFMETSGAFYTVVVAAFDPIRHGWIAINSSVWLAKPSDPIQVTLLLTYSSADIPAGTLITGQLYLCTGLPESGGRTLIWIPFAHLVM